MTRLTETEIWKIAYDNLTPNQIRALELRHIAGHTYDEIALELNITRQAARDRVRTAHNALRRIIAHRKAA